MPGKTILFQMLLFAFGFLVATCIASVAIAVPLLLSLEDTMTPFSNEDECLP